MLGDYLLFDTMFFAVALVCFIVFVRFLCIRVAIYLSAFFRFVLADDRRNRRRSIYQYSNMAPRLSGQTSIFGVVFFVSKSLLRIERQKKL